MRTTINEVGYLTKYLPPYSPFLNPIKNMISAWKEFVRQRLTSEKHLMELIEDGSKLITSDHCNGDT